MSAHTWPAIVTLLNVLLMGWTAYLVARARARYGIKAPAVTGDPAFERCYRIQVNTIESSLMFLPLVWLAHLYGGGLEIGGAGLLWIVGRVLYALGYQRDAAQRSFGYGVSLFALCVLLVDVLFRFGRALLIS